MGAYTAIGGEGKDAQREAWKQIGKDQVAWDDFARGDADYATGRLTYNSASTVAGLMEGGGLVKGADAASDAGRVGRGARDASRVGQVADKIDDGLTVKPHAPEKSSLEIARELINDPNAQRVDTPRQTSTATPPTDPPRGKITPADPTPVPQRTTLPDIPSTDSHKGYPNNGNVDDMMKNEVNMDPNSPGFGTKADGTPHDEASYGQVHLQRNPESHRPVAYDVDGTPVDIHWRDDIMDGFHPDFPIVELNINQLDPRMDLMRLGHQRGFNTTVPGVNFDELSLSPYQLAQELHMYKFLDIANLADNWKVKIGVVAPDHGRPGGAPQLLFEGPVGPTGEIGRASIEDLMGAKILAEMTEDQMSNVLEIISRQRITNG